MWSIKQAVAAPAPGSFDLRLCLSLNRVLRRPAWLALFRAATRLGDGPLWLFAAAVLLAVQGAAALPALGRMAVATVAGLVTYRWLKARIGRERPFAVCSLVEIGLEAPDRFSFPSGHTLHAVALTALAVAALPVLGWVLVPAAATIAVSRVVLGLHYPSDVLAGAVLGLALAAAASALF